MRWPWQRQGSGEQLVVSWSGQTFAYVLARSRADGAHEVLKFGVERQGGNGMQDLVPQLHGLGLKGFEARVMLRPEQYQLLQIDAPAVAPEELRSAARYQIREMLHAHVDDVTLDVMRVGDGQQHTVPAVQEEHPRGGPPDSVRVELAEGLVCCGRRCSYPIRTLHRRIADCVGHGWH